MVQLTQSNQLSQVQGSAGNQSVIQDRSPTAGSAIGNFLETTSAAYDAVGTIYSKNQAQNLVGEELENVDAAVALAERKARDENFVTPDDMPVSSSEFTVIEQAVRNGAMSREKARLLASSRLRTRISEQPMFADKLRRAASEVVGFNIQSEPAQQYFAAFQTEAQLAQGGGNSYKQKLMEKASAIAPVYGVTTEEMYIELVQREEISNRKEAAINRQDLEGASNIDTFTTINQENSKTRFTSILGTFKEQFGQTGSVDEAAAEIILAEAEAAELAELEQIWTGNQSSAEFGRARDTIAASFDQIREYAQAVGYDRLNEINIKRAEDARTMLGDQMFAREKFIAENLGQQIAAQHQETLANITEPSRLEAMFRSNPTLGRVGAILGNPTATKAFGGQMSKLYEEIAAGNPIEDNVNPETGVNDQDAQDIILAGMFNNGGEEGEKGALDYLTDNEKPIKKLSLVVGKAVTKASKESKDFFKNTYSNDVPRIVDRLSAVLTTNPDLEYTIKDNGAIELVQPRPQQGITGGKAMREDIRRVQQQMPAYNEASELVEHLNLYSNGMDKGWGTVANTSPQEHRRTVFERIDRNKESILERELTDMVLEGTPDEGTYQRLQEVSPEWSNLEFRFFEEAVRREYNLGD